MRGWVFVFISFAVVVSATVGFLIFFLHSPLEGIDDGSECVNSPYYQQLIDFFDRGNVLGISLPSLIGGVLCVLSFGPPSLYSCSKGEGYINIDLYYFATLLHAVFTLSPLVCFAYSVSVLDKTSFKNVHGVLRTRFGCSDAQQVLTLSEFDTLYSLCRVSLYSLVVAILVGHSPLVVRDEKVHPVNDDETTTAEKRSKSVAAPMSMVCIALSTLLFAYLTYDVTSTLPFEDACVETTGVVGTMLFRYSLLCTLSCAMAFVLTGMSYSTRQKLRANESSNTHYHQQMLRTYTTTHVLLANIILIASVSILHTLFVYDWVLAAQMDTSLTANQCNPEFTVVTKVLYCCAIGIYTLAVVVPHLGWLTQKARPDDYSRISTTKVTPQSVDA